MRLYVTRQGDMWDSVSYSQLGDVAHAGKLMSANRGLLGYYVFPAGVTLLLPDIAPSASDVAPPWKRVVG